jgi:multidrug efflux pump subunit AcrA (membrane-fusion protein)
VPVQAVFTDGRDQFVYVPASGRQVRRHAVQVGRASEAMAEVLSGLSGGERVLLRKPRAGEVEQPSKEVIAHAEAEAQPSGGESL